MKSIFVNLVALFEILEQRFRLFLPIMINSVKNPEYEKEKLLKINGSTFVWNG